jgi:3',5'-cyclic AMP phosphodiesterase CpdA
MAQIAALLDACPIPTVCVMGNHDAYVFEPADFYALLGGHEPTDVTAEGKTLLFLSANHNPDGSPYHPHDFRWDKCYVPTEGLAERIAAATGDVTVFLHQNLDPTVESQHILSNAPVIRRILEQSGKVRTVYQGHYHPGNQTEQNGIRYVTLPSLCTYEDAVEIITI